VKPGNAAVELREHMQGQLARYKTPYNYEFVDHSLRDDAGKVRKNELVSASTSNGQHGRPIEEPDPEPGTGGTTRARDDA
jgi:acyl-CoA synthetase (AMP-forming)/AMP-acid ligase II